MPIYVKQEPIDRGTVVLQDKIWLSVDGEIVDEHSPEAHTLLGVPGDVILESEAKKYGLSASRAKSPVGASEGDEGPDVGPVDAKLEDLTMDQLKARLEERSLPTSGKKKDLVDRLVEAGVPADPSDPGKQREPGEDKSRKPGGDK